MEKVKRASVAIFVPHVGCPHKCSFCDQKTISGAAALPHAEDVKSACERAIESGADLKNTEIAFFGGSFTAIPHEYMFELLDAASEYLKKGFKGIRLSTRPDAINEEVLNILSGAGVTSIELGAQSMSDEVLLANGRGHTADDVKIASELVKSHGFTLGLQMMVGLYRSTPELDMMTAKRLIELKPSEARIYPTVILRNTRLGELFMAGEYVPYSFDAATELCSGLLEMFENAGIRVVKLGLHSSRDVEKDMLGGLYHPAFRELCESLIYRNRMEKLINGIGDVKDITFAVPERELSKALGQKKANIEYFRSKGIAVRVISDAAQRDKISIKS